MVGRSYIKSEQEIWGLRERVWKERWRVWGRNNRRQATWRDARDQGGDPVVMLPEEKGMASDRKGLVQCGGVCPPQLQIGCLCYPKVENVSSSVVSDSLWPHGLQSGFSSWNSPGKNTGVGCHFLLQGIFPGTKPRSPTLHADSLRSEPRGKPQILNL